MRSSYHHALLLGVLALSACTGQPPPPPAQPVPQPTQAPPPTSTAPAEPDLSPAPAPKNVVAVGRWANVAGSMKAAEKVGKLPFPLDSVLQKELDDKDMFALLKLDSSIDGVLILDPSSPSDDPKPLGAVSLPLRSLKDAVDLANRAGKPVTLRPGVYRIGRARNMVCDLSASVGDAPARLICSEHERDLDLLVPWMTRTLPTEKLGTGDLHFELRAEGLRDRYKEELERFGPVLPGLVNKKLRDEGIQQQALIDLASNMAGDLPKVANDLDVLSLDMKLDGEKSEASVSGAVRFKSNSSWVTKMMTHRNDKAGAPPAIFWQAPKDSDSASFNRGTDPKLFDGLREGLAAGVQGLLGGKIDGGDVKAISDLFAKLPLTDAQAVVVARGHIDSKDRPKPIKKEDVKPADVLKATQEQVRHAVGWSLVGIEAKGDQQVAWLRDLVKAYNSKTLQATIKKGLGKGGAEHLPTVKSVGAPKGAPAGTFAVEFSLPVSSKDLWHKNGRLHGHREMPKAEAKGNLSLLVTVTPDGNRTWIGVSSDAAALGSHLAAVKEGAPKEGTLASHSGLDALKNGTVTGGGFLSIGAIVTAVSNTSKSFLSERERKELDGAIAAMPNKGETPILMLSTGTTGATPTNSVEVRFQKGTLDDMAGLGFYIANRSRHPSETDSMEPAPVPPPPPPLPKVAPPKKKKLAHGGGAGGGASRGPSAGCSRHCASKLASLRSASTSSSTARAPSASRPCRTRAPRLP